MSELFKDYRNRGWDTGPISYKYNKPSFFSKTNILFEASKPQLFQC